MVVNQLYFISVGYIKELVQDLTKNENPFGYCISGFFLAKTAKQHYENGKRATLTRSICQNYDAGQYLPNNNAAKMLPQVGGTNILQHWLNTGIGVCGRQVVF
jgi:hypothetical protein